MSFIVVDKSYLESLSGKDALKDLASKHRIVVSDILMYEISTTLNESKKLSCFNKLLNVHNALEFLPVSMAIIRDEMGLAFSRHTLEYKFYPTYMYPSFYVGLSKLADKNVPSGNRYNDLYFDRFEITDVEFIKKLSSCISNSFPEIRGLKAGENNKSINKIIKAIGNDDEIVKTFYKEIYRISNELPEANLFPPVELINKRWALFRHVQVYLVAAVIHVGKYGDKSLYVNSKNLAHNSVDYEYIISGTLSNGIATKDKLVREIYSACCPDGIVYNKWGGVRSCILTL